MTKFIFCSRLNWFCLELLLYPMFLNYGLTLQAPVKVILKNIFQVVLDKIFQSKYIWLDAENITVSVNWIGCNSKHLTGADPGILKRGGALWLPPWLTGEKDFRFQMVQKGQNNVRNYKFLAKYFSQHFQIFSIFIYNESLPMKSYQFFKIS